MAVNPLKEPKIMNEANGIFDSTEDFLSVQKNASAVKER